MEFRKLTIEDRKHIERYADGKLGWENSFACVWAWNVSSEHRIFVDDDFTLLYNKYGAKRMFSAPYCSTDQAFLRGIDCIEQYCKQTGSQFIVANLSARQASLLTDERFNLTTSRNSYDYLYNATDLINLEGKKYHSKRNFVNRFTQKYNWNFRDYQNNDFDQVHSLLRLWLEGRDASMVEMETTALKRTIDYSDKNDVRFGVLEVDGKIVGFSVGQIVAGVGHTLFEKADISYEGVYQALNNMFAKRYYQDVKYVNRQEDMGVEGLRKAKMSYHPAILLEKYRLTYNK